MEKNKISIRAIERRDLEQLRNWRNSPEIFSRVREYRFITSEMQERWFDSLSEDRKTVMFAIEYNRGPVHIPAGALLTPRPSDLVPVILIGCCGLTYIDWISRRAEVSIYIGDKRFQQKGFGTTALDLLAGYAFRSCNLRKLTAEIYGSNLASIKLFQKAGYEREGILSGHVFKNGIYEDSHLYCLFLFDWKEVPKCAI